MVAQKVSFYDTVPLPSHSCHAGRCEVGDLHHLAAYVDHVYSGSYVYMALNIFPDTGKVTFGLNFDTLDVDDFDPTDPAKRREAFDALNALENDITAARRWLKDLTTATSEPGWKNRQLYGATLHIAKARAAHGVKTVTIPANTPAALPGLDHDKALAVLQWVADVCEQSGARS